MKKFLGFLSVFLLTTISALSADMRFVQVDGALFNVNNTEPFIQLINKINNEKDVEFIVFTGNNIANPNKENLKGFLKEAKKLKKPFYIVLGQKDVNIKKDMGKKDYMKIVRQNVRFYKKIYSPNYSFVKKKLAFVVADGSKEVIPTSIGYYKDDVILWLDDELDKYQDKNVVILQHYPIIPPAKKETHYTYKADEYLKLLTEHKNVKAVVAGHFGVNNEQEVNGILHIATKNAPCYRIVDVIDYESENPTFWSIIKE